MASKVLPKNILIAVISLIPAGYLSYHYRELPEIVPVHFDLSGNPDRLGNKNMLVLTTMLLCLVSVGVYFLIKFLPKIDPKKTAKIPAGSFEKIGIGLVVFLSALNMIIIYASISGGFHWNRLFIPLVGFFFIYMGNLIHSIKPNYFVGIRVPWTLEDPDNWRATHRFGGKLWVAGGLLIAVGTLLLPAEAGEILFMILTCILVLVPIIYSFLYFKRSNKS